MGFPLRSQASLRGHQKYGPVFQISCIQKDWDTLFVLGGYIVDAFGRHCVTYVVRCSVVI